MSGVIVRVSVIVCIQTFRSDLHRFDSHDVQSNASSQIRPRAHNERATQCKRERARRALRAADQTPQGSRCRPARRPGMSRAPHEQHEIRRLSGEVVPVNGRHGDPRRIWLDELRAGGHRRAWARRRGGEGHQVAPAAWSFRWFSTASWRKAESATKKRHTQEPELLLFPAAWRCQNRPAAFPQGRPDEILSQRARPRFHPTVPEKGKKKGGAAEQKCSKDP